MKDIAIYGAGGFGREVACLLRRINEQAPQWNLIGFFDDDITLIGTQNEYGEVLGGIEELNGWNKELSIVITIGSPHVISLIVEKITNNKIIHTIQGAEPIGPKHMTDIMIVAPATRKYYSKNSRRNNRYSSLNVYKITFA